MIKYINPLYRDFQYSESAQMSEVVEILKGLIERYDGVMPQIESKKQLQIIPWNMRANSEEDRLSVRWETGNMTPALYNKLVHIFGESVLDNAYVTNLADYKAKRRPPYKYVGFNGQTSGRSRGFPLYQARTEILDHADLTRMHQLLWVGRKYHTNSEARKSMTGRGKNYWFFSDGRFELDLRVANCKEIEFIDSALRLSIALRGGEYDNFDRYQALTLAQKQLARRENINPSREKICGLDELIEDVKFRQFFATIHPEEARSLGVTDESVLLVGVPGTGKSSIASHLLWDPVLDPVVFIPLNVIELLEASYSSDKNINTFFSGIKSLNRRYGFRPTLWCDDLEAAFLDDEHHDSKQVAVSQSTLLSNLQGVSKDNAVRISGSTNYPERIDPRFLEFGRISYMFHVPIPTDPAILEMILGSHVANRGQVLDKDVDLAEIAGDSIGFTPRMLVNLVNEAGVQAAKRIYGRFSTDGTANDGPAAVKADDYRKADQFLRSRSDVDHFRKRDEQIGEFVAKHNFKPMGFQSEIES